MGLESRQTVVPVRVERRDKGGSQVIYGYAAVFYREGDAGTEYEIWDGMVERIMPGAFDRAIKEKQDVRALFNHDPNMVLGRVAAGTMRLSVDEVGLRYEIDAAQTETARSVIASIDRGDVDGSSFTFGPRVQAWRETDKGEIRELLDLDVRDVGPVTFPAYHATTAERRADEVKAAREACGVIDVTDVVERRISELGLK